MFARRFFRDRLEAGQVLAKRLKPLVTGSNAVVLALPRGGVAVGFEVAQALHVDLDIFLVRKLGVPGREEFAMGAIASGGVQVLNHDIIRQLGLAPHVIDRVVAREQQEIERRERVYREGRPPLEVESRTVILVDDGLATGASMLAAAQALRAKRPKRIIVAVPVASRRACLAFQQHVDQTVCAETPEPFSSVGEWYEDFSQTSDAEVKELLRRAAQERVT
ncbi:MAG TPA: phosphoribosyltransferase [Bryobacteraceae bacterium]|nr:phosphoribosyltransferase [Bryobacteraceae bacterium]